MPKIWKAACSTGTENWEISLFNRAGWAAGPVEQADFLIFCPAEQADLSVSGTVVQADLPIFVHFGKLKNISSEP